MDENNLDVVRQTFGKVVYTHKTYEKASDICFNNSKWIRRINVILLALTSGSAIGSLLKGNNYSILASILSTISLFFILYQFNSDNDRLGQDYKYTAKKLWLVREKYQNFIADILNEIYDQNEIPAKRDSLLNELNQILENSISTNSKAYKEAQKALKQNEEMTFNDAEIDMFLPHDLRKEK